MIATIISTYPKAGSQNIGDALITKSLQESIVKQFGNIDIRIFWREDDWNTIKVSILESSVIFFACLAIRKDMEKELYPYLENIINTNIPYAVISAGTQLPIRDSKQDIYQELSHKTVSILRKMDQGSILFSTRGLLSDTLCKKIGLNNTLMHGDIAFIDHRYYEKVFTQSEEIKRIAISDPHYAKYFLPSIELLLKRINELFPKAELVILLHGVNSAVENFCLKKNINHEKIYERVHGLDIYDEFDIHIGFRVHAHVSALKRKIPSYLIEIDGRGVDYGLTIDEKISISSFGKQRIDLSIRGIMSLLKHKRISYRYVINKNCIEQLMVLVEKDLKDDFRKFIRLDSQIKKFQDNNQNAIAEIAKLITKVSK